MVGRAEIQRFGTKGQGGKGDVRVAERREQEERLR